MYYTHKGRRYKKDRQTLHGTFGLTPRYKREIALMPVLYGNSVASLRTTIAPLEHGGIQRGPTTVTIAAYLYLNVG
jgi:hypothetical protein